MSDNSTALIPAQMLVTDLPADQKQTFRRMIASGALVTRSLKLALLEAQDEQRKAVQEVSKTSRALADSLSSLKTKIMASKCRSEVIFVPSESLAGMGVPTAPLESKAKVTEVKLKRKDSKYVLELTLSVGDKSDSMYRSITAEVCVPAPEYIVKARDAAEAAMRHQKLVATKIFELSDDIEKAKEVGEVVEGAEAIAALTPEDRGAVQDHLKSFSKYLSASGRALVTRQFKE